MPIPEKLCPKKDPHEPHRWSSSVSPGTSFCEGVWRPHTYEEQREIFAQYHVKHEKMDPLCKYWEGSKFAAWFGIPSRLVFGIICNECRTLGKENARG